MTTMIQSDYQMIFDKNTHIPKESHENEFDIDNKESNKESNKDNNIINGLIEFLNTDDMYKCLLSGK